RSAAPLGAKAPADRLSACNVCGEPSEPLGAWRAHDDCDIPIAGTRALVFVGADHPACREALDAHPRLFTEEGGAPGHFPLLCGPCVHREGLSCRCPAAILNGGPGIRVDMSNNTSTVIVCSRGGCHRPIQRAYGCSGQRYPEEKRDG